MKRSWKYLLLLAKTIKLNDKEEKQLNYLKTDITRVMLKAENKIVGQENKSHWSPILHDTIRTVSIWRTLLTQFKTNISHQSQIKFLLQSVSSPIDTSWKDAAEIQRKLRDDYRNLQQVRSNATNLRKTQLLQKVSAMNLENKYSSSRTIINIQKIENTINILKGFDSW